MSSPGFAWRWCSLALLLVLAGPAAPSRADDAAQGPSALDEIKRRVPPEHPIDEDSPPGLLVEARLRIAARNFNATIDRLFGAATPKPAAERSRGEEIDAMLAWSRRCVEARLDAADRDSDRLLAFGVESARLKKIEGLIRERIKAAPDSFSEEDLDKITFRRLEMEYRTLRVKDRQ